jgi:hypothetical protein
LGGVEVASRSDPDFRPPLMTLQYLAGGKAEAFSTALEMSYDRLFEDVVDFDLYSCLMTPRNFGQVVEKYLDEFHAFLLIQGNRPGLEPEKVLERAKGEIDEAKKMGRANPEESHRRVKLVEFFLLSYMDHIPADVDQAELTRLYIRFRSPKTLKFIQARKVTDTDITRGAVDQKMYTVAAAIYYFRGDYQSGMAIHLEKMKDSTTALEYAKNCNTDNVWKLLADYSLTDPAFLKAFLRDLPNLPKTNCTDPVEFIQRIPDTSIVPEFEELTFKIMTE